MRKYLISLISMLVLSSLLVASYGAYVKYDILQPIGIYQDKSIMELPFLMFTDKGLAYMIRVEQEKNEQQPTEAPTETPTEAPTVAPTQTPTEAPTETPSEVPTEAPAAAPTEAPSEATTAPETEPPAIIVEENWFDDALFIGNSLVVGLRDYAPLGEADYFCSIGLTVFEVFEEWAQVEESRYCLLEDILEKNQYGKIYIHLGTNECGYPTETIMTAYGEVIDKIQFYQPEAEITIHGMLTFGRVKASHISYMVPALAERVNEELKQLAEQKQVHYIDFNPYIVDEEGYLPDDWSGDGCHPRIPGYRQWSQWILENAGSLSIGLDG